MPEIVMYRCLCAAALLAASPAFAQNRSPFQGATPDTLVLDNGWQMTPQEDRCTLTHHAQGAGQDLVILAPRHDNGLVLGIILPSKGAYTKPVQLTIVAQGNEAQQIGRVTFNPTTGPLGTLLMANWPADRLLPRLTHADRLNVYASDQRLLRSVRLAGSVAAMQALNRCRDMGSDDNRGAPSNAAVTPEPEAIDAGWVREFDKRACSIKRETAKGNELDLVYSHGEGLVMIYRTLNGPRPMPGSKVTAQISLWRLAPGSPVVGDQDNLPPGEMTMAARNQMPLLSGRVPTGLLDQLHNDHWNTIGFGTINSGPVDINDIARMSGSAGALDAMALCIRGLSWQR